MAAPNNQGPPPAYPPYNSPQPYQQFQMQPGAGVGYGASPVQHHRTNTGGNTFFSQLVNQEERRNQEETRIDVEDKEEKVEDDLLRGFGPGMVPQKYFMLDFETFLKEDKDTQTFEPIYKTIKYLYLITKSIVYHFFVIMVGIVMSLVWGILNGILIFVLVWLWAPVVRMLVVMVYASAPLISVPMHAYIAPFFDAVARSFSQIRTQVTLGGRLGLDKSTRSGGSAGQENPV